MAAYISTYGRPLRPEAPTALFVHGAGMDHTVWALQGRHLAFHGWNALAVDLPGHGRSRHLPAAGSIEAIADGLAELIGAERPVTLVGHSMGALAALATAARHPERVAGLCLLGAAARMPVHPDLLALAAAHDPKAVELICDWAFGPRGQVGGNPQPGGWLQGTARALLRRGNPSRLEHRSRRLQRLRRRPRARGPGPLPDPGRDRRPGPHDPAQGRAGAGGGDPGRARGHHRRRPATW